MEGFVGRRRSWPYLYWECRLTVAYETDVGWGAFDIMELVLPPTEVSGLANP